MKVYYSIIPDKSIFAENYMPGFDLEAAESIFSGVLSEYEYIRIADSLAADNFYKTDLHWDQSSIGGAANRLLDTMGAAPIADDNQIATAGEWRGVFAGQLALPVGADTMKYFEAPNLRVSYLSDKTLEFDSGPVYDLARFSGVDPYDMFLCGPQPIIVIENDAAPQRELYLFRDSFGSSLAPLLAGSYSKITVIDLRYINLAVIEMFIEYTPGSDVLFIFSSQVLNNPSILQA